MAALRSSFVAIVGHALSIIAGAPAEQASPARSELSDDTEDDQDACVQRAQASFDADGWQNVSTNGYSILAARGPLSGVIGGVIVCLYKSLTQSTPVIVVAGGGGMPRPTRPTRCKAR
jgi:hypothetical protein